MNAEDKLVLVKTIHTAIWLAFNAVLIYLYYAAISNEIDKWVWLGLGSFVAEGLVLLIFKNVCPLTLIARKYSSSTEDNFDIYLPNWLARHNKKIYTALLLLAVLLISYRLVS